MCVHVQHIMYVCATYSMVSECVCVCVCVWCNLQYVCVCVCVCVGQSRSHTHQTGVELSNEHAQNPQQPDGECKGRLVARGGRVGGGRVAVLATGREEFYDEGADPLR